MHSCTYVWLPGGARWRKLCDLAPKAGECRYLQGVELTKDKPHGPVNLALCHERSEGDPWLIATDQQASYPALRTDSRQPSDFCDGIEQRFPDFEDGDFHLSRSRLTRSTACRGRSWRSPRRTRCQVHVDAWRSSSTSENGPVARADALFRSSPDCFARASRARHARDGYRLPTMPLTGLQRGPNPDLRGRIWFLGESAREIFIDTTTRSQRQRQDRLNTQAEVRQAG